MAVVSSFFLAIFRICAILGTLEACFTLNTLSFPFLALDHLHFHCSRS